MLQKTKVNWFTSSRTSDARIFSYPFQDSRYEPL